MLAFMRRPAAAASPETDAELIRRAAAGDRAAFDRLVERELPRVWRVVWRVLRHEQDTEDVVQEVFLAAHDALPGFRGEARVATWLHRIAVNKALNHRARAAEKLRRASRSLDETDAAGAPVVSPAALAAPEESVHGRTPLKALEAKELRRRLALCLEKLPGAWRAALALRDGEDLSYREMAEVLGTALGTVRSRLSRARLALKRCLEGPSS